MVPAPDNGPAEPIFIPPNGLPVAEVYKGDDSDEIIELEVVDEDEAATVQTEALPPSPPTPPREIVLIGAGHTHLQVVRSWRRQLLPNARMTLITAFDQAPYAGMLGGVIAGRIRPDDMLIDLPRLCAKAGVNLIVDRAIGLDLAAKQIDLAHQPALPFDAVSINIGSVPEMESLWQRHRALLSIQPLATFWSRFQTRQQELLNQWRDAGEYRRLQFVVVGAGAFGVELALCLEERIHNEELPIDVHLVDQASEVWPTASPAAIRRARRLLKYRGIDLHLGQPVEDFDDEGAGALLFTDGSRLRCDLAVWATTATPPAVLRGFPLPRSQKGFLQVDRTLRVLSDVPVFAVGDIADFPEPVSKVHRHSNQQGLTLWHNLKAVLSNQPFKVYEPQPVSASFLACGDGTAILDYKGWAVRSRWVSWLKGWRDRSLVRRFR